jgi:sugar phosphate isomerase/epimerase
MVTLHLNDNDGTQDSHHPPGGAGGAGGAGCTIDWPAAARHLSDWGYDGCYLWEVFSRLGGRTDTPADTLARTAAMSRMLFHAGNAEA